MHPPLPPPSLPPQWTLRTCETTDSLALLPPALSHWCSLPCVLCGTGDNSVQHWLLFCPILALAGSLLLKQPWKTRYWFLSPEASLQRRAIIGGLWVASRQFVHERSSLPPPSLAPPPAATTPLSQLPQLLALRAASIVPPFFHPAASPSSHLLLFSYLLFPHSHFGTRRTSSLLRSSSGPHYGLPGQSGAWGLPSQLSSH